MTEAFFQNAFVVEAPRTKARSDALHLRNGGDDSSHNLGALEKNPAGCHRWDFFPNTTCDPWPLWGSWWESLRPAWCSVQGCQPKNKQGITGLSECDQKEIHGSLGNTRLKEWQTRSLGRHGWKRSLGGGILGVFWEAEICCNFTEFMESC